MGYQVADQQIYPNLNLCNIITEGVQKAKENLKHLRPGMTSEKRGKKSLNDSPIRGMSPKIPTKDVLEADTDQRIMKQKKQFE